MRGPKRYSTEGGQSFENLLEEGVLKANGIDPAKLDNAVKAKLTGQGIQGTVAQALAGGVFDAHLRFASEGRKLGTAVRSAGHEGLGLF